jgi:putative transposase
MNDNPSMPPLIAFSVDPAIDRSINGPMDSPPPWALKLALARADLVRLFNQGARRAEPGRVMAAKTELLQSYNLGAWPHLFAELGKVSLATLERWAKAMHRSGDPLDLVPHWGAHRRGRRSIGLEAGKIMLAVALHPNRLHLNEVVRIGRRILAQRGIEDGLSDATYLRFLKEFRDNNYGHWLFHREGEKARNDKCDPYLVRDYSLIEVGDALVADGHILNFDILNPWTGKPKRMVLILFFDMKSSYPCGWEIMPTENTQAIAAALRRAILRLGKVPLAAYIDNGKAFGAKFFSGNLAEAGFAGLFERLGMQVIHAWPYHGQSKPVERFFKTFGELERLMPSYTGTSIALKPPRLNRGEKLHGRLHQKMTGGWVPTIFQAHRAIGAWFDEYAGRPQRGHLNGQCPADVFEAARGPGVEAEQLRYLMMSLEVRSIGRNGIKLTGEDYYHPALYGRRQPVVIRYDLVEREFILVYEPSGEFLCRAEPRPRVHPLARITGNQADRELLAQEIALKKGLAAATMREARKFAQEVVIPEAQRLLESQGLRPDATPCNMMQRKAFPLTDREAEQIQQESGQAEVIYLQRPEDRGPAPVAEAEDLSFRELDHLPELDRYEKLLELEAQQAEIPARYQTFMAFFEKGAAYAANREWLEGRRMQLAAYYQDCRAN